jgi:hypothetical protein
MLLAYVLRIQKNDLSERIAPHPAACAVRYLKFCRECQLTDKDGGAPKHSAIWK